MGEPVRDDRSNAQHWKVGAVSIREYMQCALALRCDLDGNPVQTACRIITCEGKVLEFADGTEAQRAVFIQMARDWLARVDP